MQEHWVYNVANSPVTGEFPAKMASNVENVPFDDVIMKFMNFPVGNGPQQSSTKHAEAVCIIFSMYFMSMLHCYEEIWLCYKKICYNKTCLWNKYFISDSVVNENSW